jgi:protein MYSM1
MLVMDAHAHLCTNEVIGYLGGTWDASAKRLTILKAFPGRGLASGSDVEMDPVAEVELKTQVAASEMCVVGWYHSHPVFEPNPSGVDVDNQLNYQKLFTDETCGVAPFVGFIVGPYDLRLPTRVSAVTAFVASRKKGPGGALEDVPYEAKFTVTDEAPGEAVTEALASVVDANRSTAGRINPTELWRPFTNFTNKQPAGGPCTKLAKLRASLAVRLPEETMDETARENILDGLAKRVQTSWGVDLGY